MCFSHYLESIVIKAKMFKNAIYCPSLFSLNFIKVRLLLCKGTYELDESIYSHEELIMRMLFLKMAPLER